MEIESSINNSHDNSAKAYEELLAYFSKTTKEYKKKLTFPTYVSSLENQYRTEIFPDVKKNIYSSFEVLREWDPVDVDTLIDHQVLNRLKSKNFYRLKKLIRQTTQNFLTKVNLFAEFEANAMQELLEANYLINDDILLEVAEELTGCDENESIDFKKLNARVLNIYSVLQVYQQLWYHKYELSNLYTAEFETIKEDLINQILEQVQKDYPKLLSDVDREIKFVLENCYKEFKEVFENNLIESYKDSPKIKTYIEAYQASRNYLLNVFKDNVWNRLGAMPTEVFLSKYFGQIDSVVKESIITNRLYTYLMQDSNTFKETIYQQIESYLPDFCYIPEEGVVYNLFDERKFMGKDNLARLFGIVLLTNYLEEEDSRYEIYFDRLQRLYLYFVHNLLNDYPTLQGYFELINSKKKLIENSSQIKEHLRRETKRWSETVDSSTNLIAMISLFFAFGQSNEKQFSRSYTSNDRYMLKCIFRNLKNGDGQFTNFQILCGIEAVIPTYYYKQQGIASIDLNKDEVVAPLSLMSQIRKTKVNSFKDHSKHVNQLSKLHEKLGPTLDKPSKFFLEKVSDVGIRSKTITICISGFTSEDVTKSDQWQTILDAYPYTEIFALNWNSNTMKNLYNHLLKEVPSIVAANQGSILGFAIPQLRPILLTMATFKIFRGLKDEVWGITYKEAITSGIYLAHILANTDLFKDHVVNLVGFSLGTLVIMNCIWELERLNRKDIIYDVFLMGGVANASDFNKSTLDVIGNKVINCYCGTDYILKFLLKMVNFSSKPVGLGPILVGDKKVKNIDVTQYADGHTKYRENMHKILPRVDFNEDLDGLLKS